MASLFGLIIMGAVLTMITRQSVHRQTNVESSLALSAAINNLEQIRAVPTTGLPALDGVGFDVPGLNGAPGGLPPVNGDVDGLPGKLTVALDQNTGGVSIYRVDAVVTWDGVSGPRQVRMGCLIGERK